MARSKSHRIAKRTKQQRYTPETGKWSGVDVPIYQETSGELRFFLIVSDWLVDALGVDRIRECNHGACPLIPKDQKTSEHRLYGRDPGALLESERKLHERYDVEFARATAYHFIEVEFEARVPGRHLEGPETQREFGVIPQIEFQLSTKRYARVGISWHTVNSDGSVEGQVSYDPDGTILPYTPELWQQLEQMKDRLGESIARLAALIKDPIMLPIALAGGIGLLDAPSTAESAKVL